MKGIAKSIFPKRFKKNPDKEYLKKVRFYPSFQYCKLDKWLKSMSREGWHIVDCGAFTFLFEKGVPKEKEYFTYTSMPKNEGRYCIRLMYPFLEKTYGVKPKKSQINSNHSKYHNIVEIDLKKIDVQNNVGYKEMIDDRNRLYKTYTIKTLICVLLTVMILLLIVLWA